MMSEPCFENKFELVFDERIDGPNLVDLLKEKETAICKSLIIVILNYS